MSAILELEKDGALGPDGIRRYRTTCKIIIHSHINGTFDISQDVVGLSSAKNIKGVGSATITLVGSHNYLNLIHPNDYINIYINIGDGEGWIRLFFGFVDIVREKYKVQEEGGRPSTNYVLKCSDFQKAFDKTQVYFNPHMAGREDFGGEQFGTVNIGGVALITKGITASGSPANIVQNLMILLFGFGTQFRLPSEYGANPAVINKNRADRKDFLVGELGHVSRSEFIDKESFAKIRELFNSEAESTATQLASMSESDAIQVLEERYGIDPGTISGNNIDTHDIPKISKLIADADFRRKFGPKHSFHESDPSLLQALDETDNVSRYSLLDLIDAFTFFEDESIDGFAIDTVVWESEGAITDILRDHAHEEVNELFFDLRPMTPDDDFDSRTYSREPDDIAGNIGEDATVGIQYVPAVIMREYPFGTVSRIDASDYKFNLKDINGATEGNAGVIEVGALFSDKPNQPGRHVIGQPSLSLLLNATGRSKSSKRKIDVAVIDSSQIREHDLGRSDSDHFNLFEVYSGDYQINNMKWIMADVLPITTPIHIMRHGLRRKTYVTRWAQFSLDISGQEVRKEERFKALALGDVSQVTENIPKVPGEPTVSNGLSASDSELPQSKLGDTVTPIEISATGNTGRITSSFGYRTRDQAGNVKPAATVFANGGKWVHHNGVDIKADIGTPVRAVMDGLVVASVPNGVYSRYGETIIIKHKAPDGLIVYTQYSHLSKRNIGSFNVSPIRSVGEAKDINAHGVFIPIPVKAGDVIGEVGITEGTSLNRDKTFSSSDRAHLHFEYMLKFENRVYPTADKPRFVPDIEIIAGSPVTPPPISNTPRCLDPEQKQADYGAPLSVSGAVPEEEDIGSAEPDDEQDGATNSPTAGVSNAINATDLASELAVDSSGLKIDSTDIRRQLLRWGLLQDHWYQHNLEYVSGQITMRGAPEIRCGYRLDITDRRMSFYVDGVSHNWQFPDKMTTILNVSRGQSNNPFPMYVMPPLPVFVDEPGEQRGDGTRLSMFQILPDPLSVHRAIVFRNTQGGSTYIPGEDRTSSNINTEPSNETDIPFFVPPTNKAGKPVKEDYYNDYVLHAEVESTVEGDSGLSPELASALDELFPGNPDATVSIGRVTGQDSEGPNK